MMLKNINTGSMVEVIEYFESAIETFKEIFPNFENRTAEDFEHFINEDTDFVSVDDNGEELEEPTAEYYETYEWALTRI